MPDGLARLGERARRGAPRAAPPRARRAAGRRGAARRSRARSSRRRSARSRRARPREAPARRGRARGRRVAEGRRGERRLVALGQHRRDRHPLLAKPLVRDAQQILGSRGADGVEIARLEAMIARRSRGSCRACARCRRRSRAPSSRRPGSSRAPCRARRRSAARGASVSTSRATDSTSAQQLLGLEVGGDAEDARVEGRPAGGVEAVAEALAVLHPAREARALALAEDEGEQVEERRVGVGEGHRRPAHLEAGALEGAPQQQRAHAVLRRLRGAGAARAAAARAGEGAPAAARARSLRKSPANTTAKFSAVYQRSKKARTRARSKRCTLSREPRIGAR